MGGHAEKIILNELASGPPPEVKTLASCQLAMGIYNVATIISFARCFQSISLPITLKSRSTFRKAPKFVHAFTCTTLPRTPPKKKIRRPMRWKIAAGEFSQVVRTDTFFFSIHVRALPGYPQEYSR